MNYIYKFVSYDFNEKYMNYIYKFYFYLPSYREQFREFEFSGFYGENNNIALLNVFMSVEFDLKIL